MFTQNDANKTSTNQIYLGFVFFLHFQRFLEQKPHNPKYHRFDFYEETTSEVQRTRT